MFFDLNIARARALDALWGPAINQCKGAAPRSLGVAHMLAETNGNETPRSGNPQTQPTGIMRVPVYRARKLGYQEAALTNPILNIYVWSRLTNDDAAYIHEQYANWWQTPDIDFWCSVRLLTVLTRIVFNRLLLTLINDNLTTKTTAGIQAWINETMPKNFRIGVWTANQLKEVSKHIDNIRTILHSLDGPRYTSTHFSQRNIPVPSTETQQYQNVTPNK